MANRRDWWAAIIVGTGVTLAAACTVIIWPSQLFAWIGLWIDLSIMGGGVASLYGGYWFRIIGVAVATVLTTLLLFFVPHSPVFHAPAK
jgi:hypothetical protein